MIHKQVSLSFVLAYAGWLTAFGTWLIAWVVHSLQLGQLGVLFGLMAGTTSLRLWMLQSVTEIRNCMAVIREVERDGSVRPMR